MLLEIYLWLNIQILSYYVELCIKDFYFDIVGSSILVISIIF